MCAELARFLVHVVVSTTWQVRHHFPSLAASQLIDDGGFTSSAMAWEECFTCWISE